MHRDLDQYRTAGLPPAGGPSYTICMLGKRSNLNILRIEDQDVPLTVTRHPRARRLTLRLDPVAGALRLALPRGVALAEGLDFAQQRSDWILTQLESLPPRVAFADGAEVPYLGESHRICHDPQARRGVWRAKGSIRVSGRIEHLSRRITDFLKREARREMTDRAHLKAAKIDRRVARVSLRDTQSRWGSCSADGCINFSWRLILAPDTVLDYVVAHEVTHLVHMNHGPRFWVLVDKLTAETEAPRRWLRKNGASLLRYG